MARAEHTTAGVADATTTVTGGHLILLQVQHMATPGRVSFNIGAAAVLDADDMINVPTGMRRIVNLGDHDGSIDVHHISSQASTPITVEAISPGDEEYLI